MKKQLTKLILFYFRILSKIQLAKNDPIIVGITGTAGKTTALSAIEAVLKNTAQIKVSHKANSETGIPLNILGISPKDFSILSWLYLTILAPFQLLFNWEKYEYYVVEMGIDSPYPPKNMEYLLKIIQPHIGVFLNAMPMHSEAFDSLVAGKENASQVRRQLMIEAIANEKGKMIESLPSASAGGVAILNADQAEVMAFTEKTRARVLTFGWDKKATVRVVKIEQSLEGTTIEFSIQNENENENPSPEYLITRFPDYLLPDHFAHTFGAAICVGLNQGLSTQATGKFLEKNYELPPGRSSLIPGINGSWIIDSSYNSSTKPVIDLLEMMQKISKKTSDKIDRKIALLGEMRELGKESQFEHELVAQKASEICDEVVLVGPEMKKYVLPILEKNKKPVSWFKNAYEAADYLKKNGKLDKNDLLLVKGSQNTLFLEIAVERLMAEPEKANKLLCRRENFWNKKREEIKS